jgi:hypothetical protein
MSGNKWPRQENDRCSSKITALAVQWPMLRFSPCAASGGLSMPDSIADEDGNVVGRTGGRAGGSPSLKLDGFAGPLDHLLALARAQKIDLSGIALIALLDQRTAALRQAPTTTPWARKATGW